MTMKNKDLQSVTLDLNKAQTIHTIPEGSVVKIKKIGKEYFSKFKDIHKKNPYGSSWAFDNHIEYNGWLAMNSFVSVDIEELEGKWS